MGIRHVYQINIQCNKVKVIVILFSYYSNFAIYLEDYFMDLCDTWNIGSCDTTIDIITNVGHLDLYFMVH